MAAVTVREILTLAVWQGTYVLAGGSGLGRRVTGVNVMEVPDIEAFVREGEILLTTAYPVRERPERLVELVPELAARGLAALAIKPLRYLTELPERLVAEADRLDFPVLVVPACISFSDVIGAVLAVVLAEYGAEPGRAEAIRERLTGVALAGGGLEEIARTLAGALSRDLSIFDEEGVVLGVGLADAPAAAAGPPPAQNPSPGAQPWPFPITVGGAVRGCIAVGGRGEPTLGQRRLIRQACFAAGMHIAQALASLELDRRLRVLFLEELVTGPSIDEPWLRQRSRLFGWDLTGDHTVVLARCGVELGDGALLAAAHRILPRGTLAWSRGHEVVAVTPTGADTWGCGKNQGRRAAPDQAWHDALHELTGQPVTVSTGCVATTPAQIAASHTAARHALQIADATGRSVVRHDDLVLERLLLAVPSSDLRQFVDHELGPLLDHDRDTDGDLCRTLEAYLGVGNAAEAARRLFIHYNTMKHRLGRIVALTDADLHDPGTRLALAMALEIRKLL